MELGPYDVWAISYGYTPGKTDAVLARCGEPELRYLTDEDTMGPDPMARRFDHAKNPLDYVDAQLAIVVNRLQLGRRRLAVAAASMRADVAVPWVRRRRPLVCLSV